MNDSTIGKYRAIWLNQLLIEYKDICWNYNLDLIPPLFEISDLKREGGSWHPSSRTMRLSRYLIAGNPWQVTLQVLKHEMVHQLCSERFGSSETGHGRDFQRGCRLLGVEPEFCGSRSSLPELQLKLEKGSDISEKGRRFISRVEKLFALARSPNENEAGLAMQKANELIEKYNLSFFEGGEERQFGYAVINRRRKRIEAYQRHICRILQDFFFVRVVISSLYDPMTDQNYKVVELLGTRENVTIAEYCYSFLENKLVSLWAHNRYKFKGRTITEKNSYFLGLLAGFYDKLAQQKESRKEAIVRKEEKALVTVAEKELTEYVETRFPRLRKVSRKAARIYRNTYNDGVATGKTITLAKGVAGVSVQSGRFLPGKSTGQQRT
ncbi:MAG: DUF2786 domain-containing protein [Deltaproteobacteria bacterium]|nr:DUF2786 domain-containing protein [Deltaproteobacteria bacterium]